MQPPSTTGLLIVAVFIVFIVLWFIDRRDTRLALERAERSQRERDEAAKEEREALEQKIARRDELLQSERRRLDEEARADRKETHELIRQLSRSSDAVQHAVTGLEKTVNLLLSKD